MAYKSANIIQNFMQYVKNLDAEDFARGILFCFGAPTIQGIKASCLINFRRHSHEDMRSIWKAKADEWLNPLGVQWLLLNDNGENISNALVLIYRRELLERALSCNEACEILKIRGYPLNDVEGCLDCLCRKFCEGFPHEIGLFLDYPPYDVLCFMENRKCEKCAKLLSRSYWKVYGNVRRAKRAFRKYKRAEYDAARLILAGE